LNMPDNTSQPTVLVKKTDGTYVRMTLAELETLKNQKSQTADRESIYSKAGKQEISGESRNKLPEMKDWSKEDAKSLLEEMDEAMEAFHPAIPTISQKRTGQVEEVMRNKGFQAPQQLVDRLRSVIQLRLKDIRSEEETKDVLARSVKEGGLGLTDPQAETVVRLCADAVEKEIKKEVAVYHEPGVPATATPFNVFVRGEGQSSPLTGGFKGGVVPSNDSMSLTPPYPPHRGETENQIRRQTRSILNSQPVKKVVVNDITAPPLEMGPIEEIRYMNLTEFRRLSSNPAEAASRLRQKILTIKDESFLMYMDAREAWRQSPLYTQYLKKVIEAITKRKSLSSVLGEPAGIKMEEIMEIVGMEGEL